MYKADRAQTSPNGLERGLDKTGIDLKQDRSGRQYYYDDNAVDTRRMMMAEWIQAIAAVIGTVIAGLGFYYVVQQLIQNRDATKNQTRWAIAQVSCDVYRVFVDKPELALELFANESASQRSGPGAAETTARLDAAAEMIFDYFEAIVESAGAVDQHTHNAWRLYMRQTLQASALLRSFFDREKHRFTPSLREELAGTVDELREQMDRDHGPSR